MPRGWELSTHTKCCVFVQLFNFAVSVHIHIHTHTYTKNERAAKTLQMLACVSFPVFTCWKVVNENKLAGVRLRECKTDIWADGVQYVEQ